ncbi:hypothetical protein GY45DRAFT_1264691 [Cubamyces sp. BRFM 1775]|nr:hypothetical protein GY45DRAFT_1264691 [Cubamyces sp. BRFM 1775]
MANPAETTFGSVTLALIFTFILYGITILQTFIYYQKYPGDRITLKALVTTILVLETVHTAFCVEVIYGYLLEGFGNYEGFLDINWCASLSPLNSGQSSITLRMTLSGTFYTRRVWIVSGNTLIWTIVIVRSKPHFSLKSASILTYKHPQWEAYRHDKASFVAISGGLASSGLADILVALTLTFYLKRGRHTSRKESNSMINRILLYAVNTGAITAIVSLLCGLLFAVKRSSLVFLGLAMIQAKLYASSLLASLNARLHIQNKGSRTARSSPSGIGSSFRFTNPQSRPGHILPVRLYHSHSIFPVICSLPSDRWKCCNTRSHMANPWSSQAQ